MTVLPMAMDLLEGMIKQSDRIKEVCQRLQDEIRAAQESEQTETLRKLQKELDHEILTVNLQQCDFNAFLRHT